MRRQLADLIHVAGILVMAVRDTVDCACDLADLALDRAFELVGAE